MNNPINVNSMKPLPCEKIIKLSIKGSLILKDIRTVLENHSYVPIKPGDAGIIVPIETNPKRNTFPVNPTMCPIVWLFVSNMNIIK